MKKELRSSKSEKVQTTSVIYVHFLQSNFNLRFLRVFRIENIYIYMCMILYVGFISLQSLTSTTRIFTYNGLQKSFTYKINNTIMMNNVNPTPNNCNKLWDQNKLGFQASNLHKVKVFEMQNVSGD